MTFDQAITEAKKRAKTQNRVVFVSYCDWHTSPDWRNRYIASDYLSVPSHKDIKAQVFPDGRVHNRAGEVLDV